MKSIHGWLLALLMTTMLTCRSGFAQESIEPAIEKDGRVFYLFTGEQVKVLAALPADLDAAKQTVVKQDQIIALLQQQITDRDRIVALQDENIKSHQQLETALTQSVAAKDKYIANIEEQAALAKKAAKEGFFKKASRSIVTIGLGIAIGTFAH